MISCRPVRISRADVAAETGMPERYQMGSGDVTREESGAARADRTKMLRKGDASEALADYLLALCPECLRVLRVERIGPHAFAACGDRLVGDPSADVTIFTIA